MGGKSLGSGQLTKANSGCQLIYSIFIYLFPSPHNQKRKTFTAFFLPSQMGAKNPLLISSRLSLLVFSGISCKRIKKSTQEEMRKIAFNFTIMLMSSRTLSSACCGVFFFQRRAPSNIPSLRDEEEIFRLRKSYEAHFFAASSLPVAFFFLFSASLSGRLCLAFKVASRAVSNPPGTGFHQPKSPPEICVNEILFLPPRLAV